MNETTGKVYGYIRVSTREQNEDRQRLAMWELGISDDYVYLNKQSGKDFERPGYKRLMRKIKPGDTLVIKSIDRLGRNYPPSSPDHWPASVPMYDYCEGGSCLICGISLSGNASYINRKPGGTCRPVGQSSSCSIRNSSSAGTSNAYTIRRNSAADRLHFAPSSRSRR